MKKTLLSLALALTAVAFVQAKGAGDQVLMTVNGKPVTLGEFEYLYHKNNSQQVAPQSIDEYLQMFITYKQKVADAEAEGIENSDAFKSEYEGYRRELAQPYLKDQAVEDSIVNSIYDRMKEEVRASHIMLASGGEDANPAKQRQLLDSIRTAIVNGADFETLARQYSIDRTVARNGGDQGVIIPLRFPYQFEEAAYATQLGEISPVIETPFGLHIIKVTDRRPNRGMVQVQHILKLTQGLDDAEVAVKRAQIDSIATLLANGGDFKTIAAAETDDPGTKTTGGLLQWFGAGQMVPAFEKAAFELADGEISGVVETPYGFHIIRRLGHKDMESLETMAPMIKNAIARDERGELPHQRRVQALRAKFKAQINQGNLHKVRKMIEANGGVDSALVANFKKSNLPLAQIGKQKITLSQMASYGDIEDGSADDVVDLYEKELNNRLTDMAEELEREDMVNYNADYRNLLNEYRDGMLLFEVSDRKVWSKAKEDKAGLEQYFEQHRPKYRWDRPKYKAFVVFATSDSLLNEVKSFLADCDAPNDQLAKVLADRFGKDVKIDRVIAAKGENAITDYLGFEGEKPATKGKWAWYFGYRDKVIDQPEESTDVRGAVTADYQTYLEDIWVDQLHHKYPAKVNQKVLQQAK